MKIGMTTVTFRNKSVEEIIRISKDAALDGLEWAEREQHVVSGNKERIELIKRLSEENGIEIFAYGSYCRMTDKVQCWQTVETAALLGAPVIRVWAGEKGSAECDEQYYSQIVQNTRYMAELAEKEGIKIAFEYHPNTLTDSDDAAVLLAKTVGRDNVGLYWQTDENIGYEENKIAFEKIKPYMFRNLHVNTYTKDIGYRTVAEFYEDMYGYFNPIASDDYNLIIEFVKNHAEENLICDAGTLRKIII